MQKPQRSSFKIATCEKFQKWRNATLQEGCVIVGYSDTDGRAIYNQYSPLTTSVW